MAKAGDIKSPYRGPDIDRRRFIATSLKAGGALVVTLGATAALYDRKRRNRQGLSSQVRDFAVAADRSHPELVMVHEEQPSLAVDRALEALGGIERFIEPDDRVAIKPNIAWERYPEQAANTNPEVVGRLVELCIQAGAREVIVADNTCNDPHRTYEKSGIGRAAYTAGAVVLLPDGHRFRDIELGGVVLNRWPMFEALLTADKLINVPIVKHHGLTGVTAVFKNWYGMLGGTRSLLHQDIQQSLFDLAYFIRPTLTLVDAIRVLVRNGPQGGRFEDVQRRNTVIAGTDQVACEALAVTLLGRRPDEFRFLTLADGVLGQANTRRVRFLELP